MNGIVYLLENRQIILIVPDVVSYTEADIIGKDSSVKGIDLAQASFVIVDATTQDVGDVLREVVDKRESVPKTELELLREDNATLNLQIIDLFETLLAKGVI